MKNLSILQIYKNKNEILIALTDNSYMLYHITTGVFCRLLEEEVLIRNNIPKILSKDFNELIKKQVNIQPNTHEVSNKLSALQYMSSECCNMRCKYCYANGGTYNNPTNDRLFTFEKYRDSYNSILKLYSDGVESISFFGGEPLLNYKEIDKFLKYNEENRNTYKYSIITNGTIFHDEIFEMLKKYRFSITVSVDGPKEINDFSRVDVDGNGTFDKVSRFIAQLNSNEMIPAIEMTITKKHILSYEKGKIREWIQFLNDYNVKGYAPFIVVDSTISYNDSELEQIKSIFKEFVDIFFADLLNESTLVNLKILKMVYCIVNRKYQKDCGAGRSITIANNGYVYPCQMFVNDSKYRISLDDISPIVGNTTLFRGMNSYRINVNKCNKCNVRNFCGVWCRGLNYLNNNSINVPIEIRCKVENIMFERILENLSLFKEKEIEQFKENLSRVIKIQNGL
ncbi:radical SAM/SPASM domain-containing protein [Anaerorhabdus sp.]|uniref:radical SAM/SPASM domain-containing protein n=1 Tax=Anaerorhabdus sp. TaxID=1872524 RepID=UPI002FC90096